MQKSKDIDFNWEDLRYVYCVAKEGSIAAAARKLNVNHSTVFRRLNQFEKNSSINVFIRNKNGYVLSPDGVEIMEHLEQAEKQMRSISLKLRGKDQLLKGNIRITVPGGYLEKMVLNWIHGFQQIHKQVNFIVDANTNTLDLNRREADIAIRGTMNPPEHLVGSELQRMSWRLVASDDFLKKHTMPKSFAEALELPWVGYCGDKPEALKKFYKTHMSDKPFAIQVDNFEAMSYAVNKGYGLGILPFEDVEESLVSMVFPEIALESGLWLLTHPDLIHASRISAFMSYVRSNFKGVKNPDKSNNS